MSKVVNLDYKVLHIDYNNAKWDAMKKKYGNGVELDVAAPEAGSAFILISRM